MNKSYVACIATLSLVIGYLSYNRISETSGTNTEASDNSKTVESSKNNRTSKSNSRLKTSSANEKIEEDTSAKRRINVTRGDQATGLTLAQIEELGERLKNEEDSGLRKELLEQLIAGMTADNALDIRKYIAHMSDRSYEWREFHKAYGAVAGQIAVRHGEETKGRDVELSLVGWVSADPDKAMEWYRALDEKSKKSMFSQERLSMAVLEGLAENDPKVATEFMLSLNTKGGDSWRASKIVSEKIWKQAVAAGNVEDAIKWTEELPTEDLKKSSQALMAGRYAKLDPLEAASWVEGITQQDGTNDYAVGMVVENWRKTDPAAAVNWLTTFEDNKSKLGGAYYRAFNTWADQDPNAAKQYLDSMNDSKSKDYAIYGLTRTLSDKEPEQAMNLASSIKDSDIRMRSIVSNSRTVFKGNPEGLQTWLTNSNLSSKEQERVLKYHKKRKK